MEDTKYFDYREQRPLNLESDGCALADWGRLYGAARFAWHPRGFKIFLPPDSLTSSDEYADADPYTVEQNLTSAFHQRRIELTAALLREAVSSSPGVARILDLGCGQGHITQEMHQNLSSAEFTGLDHSVSAIEYAHGHFPAIDFAVGDAYNCPYATAYFDAVVCNNLWEHVPDPVYLLSRIGRHLKPGSHIIISTPSRYRIGNLMRVLQGKPVAFMSTHHITEYTVGQVVEQLTYGGFAVERITSRPLPRKSLKGRLVQGLFSLFISAVGSHHQLEATVFYLAKKSTGTAASELPPAGHSAVLDGER